MSTSSPTPRQPNTEDVLVFIKDSILQLCKKSVTDDTLLVDAILTPHQDYAVCAAIEHNYGVELNGEFWVDHSSDSIADLANAVMSMLK